MAKKKMTPSEALVETLVAEGVKDVFGLVGSAFIDALDLFPDAGTQQARRQARVTDQVRDRFGESSVTRARLANPPSPSEDGDDDPPEASSLTTVD